MRVATDNAHTFVSSLDEWHAEDWWVLEAAAWKDHGSVVGALGRLAPKAQWQAMVGKSRRSPIWGVLGLLLHVIAIVAAVIGLSASVQWLFGRSDVALAGVAGIAFAYVALMGIWGLVEVLPKLPKDPFPTQFIGLLTIVASGLSMVGILTAPANSIAVEGAWGAIGVVCALLVGTVALVTGSRAAIRARTPEATLTQFVAKVRVEQQRAVREDIVAAVDHLVERGFISAEEAAAAKAVPPGALAVTLASSTSQ